MPISDAPEYIDMNPLAYEEEAVLWRWSNVEHQAVPIGAEDAIRILKEVRTRASEIEQQAVSMALRSMSEQRQTPRRHQLFALAVLAIGLLIVFAVVLVLDNWPW